MGRINRGIIGAVSGKVGTVVGTSWRGQDIIKSRPLNVVLPVTADRTAETNRMQNMQNLYNSIKNTLPAKFGDTLVKKMSGYNKFVQVNKALFNDAIPLPYNNFVLSFGTITPTPITGINATYGEPDVYVAWNKTLLDSTQHANDRVRILLCDFTSKTYMYNDTEFVPVRSMSSMSFDTGDWLNHETELYAYLSFVPISNLACSTSTFFKVIPSWP